MSLRTIRIALCGVLLLGCGACAVAPGPMPLAYDGGEAYADPYYPDYYYGWGGWYSGYGRSGWHGNGGGYHGHGGGGGWHGGGGRGGGDRGRDR